MDVYFLEKAWVDSKFSCNWAKKTLKQTIPDNSKFALFCDNLTAQCTDQFKEEMPNINGVVWYGLASATVRRQWIRQVAKSANDATA